MAKLLMVHQPLQFLPPALEDSWDLLCVLLCFRERGETGSLPVHAAGALLCASSSTAGDEDAGEAQH